MFSIRRRRFGKEDALSGCGCGVACRHPCSSILLLYLLSSRTHVHLLVILQGALWPVNLFIHLSIHAIGARDSTQAFVSSSLGSVGELACRLRHLVGLIQSFPRPADSDSGLTPCIITLDAGLSSLPLQLCRRPDGRPTPFERRSDFPIWTSKTIVRPLSALSPFFS